MSLSTIRGITKRMLTHKALAALIRRHRSAIALLTS